MSLGRRTTDRRRRVLYSAQPDTGPSTAASRREAARLREARCPTEVFGSRVRRQLRARWFGLVPVRRRTMSVVVGSITGIAMLLCAAHYASVAWPTLMDQGEIARPLRLDRPDSFGRWFVGMLMLGSAGASLLIYQLRRHRLDDFHGHYRLWRLVLVVMLMTCLNSVVSLIDWTGALLDVAIGKRVALAGADWIRIVVSLGGVILAIRLIAEVRRSRTALALMLVAAGLLAVPEAVKWNVVEVETIERWALVTSAPLIAFTSLFLSFGVYLRMLYRQVRRLDETDSLKDRFQQMRLRVFQRSEVDDEIESEPESESESDAAPRKRWWQRQRKETIEQESTEKKADKLDDPDERTVKSARTQKDPSAAGPKPKRRWFGLRRAKPESENDYPGSDESADQTPPAPKKRSRFSMRLKPTPASEPELVADPEGDESEESKPKRRFGLGAFRKQRAEQAATGQTADGRSRSTESGSSSSADKQYIDPEGIDWNGLSKAERRRLRKQIKRQGDAA